MALRVRRATEADGETVALMHWQGWEEAYRGLLSDALLDATTHDLRRNQWRDWLPRHVASGGLSIGEVDGEPLGFALAVPARDVAALGAAGEVQLCYVLRRGQRRGLGRALMLACTDWFERHAPGRIGLWAVTRNAPARRFYESLGGRVEGERQESLRGAIIEEVAYLWTDAESLRARSARSAD